MSQEAMKHIKAYADEMMQESKAERYSSWILLYAYAMLLKQDMEELLKEVPDEKEQKEVKEVFIKARDMKLLPSLMADAMRILLLEDAFAAKKRYLCTLCPAGREDSAFLSRMLSQAL